MPNSNNGSEAAVWSMPTCDACPAKKPEKAYATAASAACQSFASQTRASSQHPMHAEQHVQRDLRL